MPYAEALAYWEKAIGYGGSLSTGLRRSATFEHLEAIGYGGSLSTKDEIPPRTRDNKAIGYGGSLSTD